ncbi:hypothetical protein M404DRAFT_1004416, partial [Pisolithus tinctorius Marx 270]
MCFTLLILAVAPFITAVIGAVAAPDAGVCNGESCCAHGLPCNRFLPGGNCCEGLSCCGAILNPVCKYPGSDCGST